MCVKHNPAVRCLARSNFLRSISSSNASKYGHGDMYRGVMSFLLMRYSETSSKVRVALVEAAVHDNVVGVFVETMAAAAVIGRGGRIGSADSRSGIGAV